MERLEITKKIGNIKEIFHGRVGTVKDRNGRNLTDKRVKKWQEYTEELYKKRLHDPGHHAGVVTHLEPDILDCEVKWALKSSTTNKASEGFGIPA